MQVTEADQYSSKRVGVAEHLINFKSSPNFKNMKKFIRSKMDLIEKASHTAPDPPPPPNVGNTVSSEVQPPLPLEPPPPDEIYSLNVKKELDDSKFENGPSEEVSETQSKEVVNEVTGSQQEPTEKPKETICRDFIRGSCKRPGTCRYAHKFDLSQLVGVYTFCRKYQTSVCTYPICKYVHASVFEEHHFYRTGVLPPHAFAHHKKNNVVPPTVPPQQPQVEAHSNVYRGFVSLLQRTDVEQCPFSHWHETTKLRRSHPEPQKCNFILSPFRFCRVFDVSSRCRRRDAPSSRASEVIRSRCVSFSRELHNECLPVCLCFSPSECNYGHLILSAVGSSPSDRDTYEPFPKKCKHCDIMDFRLQYHKDETEKMARAKDQKTENTCLLENKKKKINTLILALFKLPSKNQILNGKQTNYGGDNDKTLLEQLSSVFTVNGRMAALGEDE
ncbi:zinc finger CCCH domain-containing protein 10 [Danaus plexippus plexippus]|uniref:Zinc finger CCCH domain-containing protein 10 n=1 Tax=Danaus plexippus plexippus TaxID=278856 RepID=A0A212EQG6_DANPL|nr:zinc finger CCCH domain-containing protein 10 [Danaus plexippus plexippus]